MIFSHFSPFPYLLRIFYLLPFNSKNTQSLLTTLFYNIKKKIFSKHSTLIALNGRKQISFDSKFVRFLLEEVISRFFIELLDLTKFEFERRNKIAVYFK